MQVVFAGDTRNLKFMRLIEAVVVMLLDLLINGNLKKLRSIPLDLM